MRENGAERRLLDSKLDPENGGSGEGLARYRRFSLFADFGVQFAEAINRVGQT